jgi:hypothetical protein
MARSSTYSTLLNSLKIPSSVFGAEYGDISNRLNARDMSFEKLQEQELQNDANNISLENAQRRQEYNKSLGDILQDESPKTMRDFYEMQLGRAIETGDGDMAAKLQAGILEYEDDQRKRKAEEFSKAVGLADDISPEILLSQYPDFPKSEAQRRFNEARKKGDGAAKERTFIMENPSTGEIDPQVPYSKAMEMQKGGWKFSRIGQYEPTVGELVSQMGGGNQQSSGTSWGETLSPFSQPGTEARGDRARQQPAPGDQVRVITRKRTAEVGKAPRG